MYDPLTFLTDVYAECQAFCAALPPAPPRPGRKPTLSLAQVLALSLLCQWAAFGSERGFHRWAGRHLHGAFCPLPAYSQFNRAARRPAPPGGPARLHRPPRPRRGRLRDTRQLRRGDPPPG